MTVLVAEDDLVSRTVLSKTLERWGHDLIATPDGDKAWAAFQEETFPVVISDWMMPGLDGLELVRRIRRHNQNGYVCTILLTARSQRLSCCARSLKRAALPKVSANTSRKPAPNLGLVDVLLREHSA